MNATQLSINKNLTSVSSPRNNCSFIISVYVHDPRSSFFPPARTNYSHAEHNSLSQVDFYMVLHIIKR
jgi:hypothetical protein